MRPLPTIPIFIDGKNRHRVRADSLRPVDVVIAGGHGKIALRLLRLLAESGDRARGLIRNPAHAAELESAGAEPVLCDLEREDDVARFVAGADAVVFAAGAGPGSGTDRKRTMDLGGALKLIDAAKANGIARYVMVSAMGAGRQERASGPIAAGLDVGYGQIARDDVAATLLAVLDAGNTIGKTFDLVEGDTPIEEAVRAL